MPAVKALGYLGLSVNDIEGWNRLLTSVFSMSGRSDNTEDRRQYRMDHLHHRITLSRSVVDRLDHVGWEVANRDELDELAEVIRASGAQLHVPDAKLTEQRAVTALYQFQGPDKVPMEIFVGALADAAPFVPKRPSTGFKTGEMGLGHVVFASKERQATVEWYCDVLGFRLTDTIRVDDLTVTFLHCNRRHHSLGVMDAIDPVESGALGHFMLEANSIDDVGCAQDLATSEGFQLALSLGRHTNDQTISFYVQSPSGWWIEYGYGGIEVDDSTWKPTVHHATKIWGHQPAQADIGAVR